MRNSNSTLVFRVVAFVSSFAMLALGAVAAEPADETTYTWFAELVAYDASMHTITVKARMVADSDKPTDFARLRAGDAAMLTWSGVETAIGIRAIERGRKSSLGGMTLPIEYVSTDDRHQYVTFKVKIPEQDAGAITKLKPGDYVTATSPRHVADSGQAIASIGPYSLGLAG
jgi:hypothetical protein